MLRMPFRGNRAIGAEKPGGPTLRPEDRPASGLISGYFFGQALPTPPNFRAAFSASER